MKETEPNDDPQQLPRATTPVWESELLISAAVVFALLQVPGAIDGAFDRIGPRVSGQWFTFAFFIALYAKIVTLAMIVTFITHLLARGFWTALIGLRSIYPRGVRWDDLPDGPNFVEVARARTRPIAEIIERVDNFSSSIFAFGALLVLFAITAFVITLVFFGLTGVVLAYVPVADRHPDVVFWGTMALFVGPLALAGLVDRYIGRSLPHDGVAARVLRAILRVGGYLPLASVTEPMRLTFASNMGRRRGMALMIGGLYVLIGLAMIDTLVHRGELSLSSYAYLPDEGDERTLQPRHYASQRRDVARYSSAPFIQSDVIRDPYVRLFVPYSPDRHSPALASACPDVSATTLRDQAEERERRLRVLECAAALLKIELDGKPVAGLQLDFGTDPESEQRGFVALIATAGLPVGRHELSLVRLPRLEGRMFSKVSDKPSTERIAFFL